MFVVMSFQYIGQKNHEITGTALLVLFIAHHLLNLNWYKNFGKGTYTAQRILQCILDALLLLDMIGLMVSGIGLSRYVFHFLNVDMSKSLARNLHMVTSHAGFLLIGLHFGLHYGMIIGMIRKAFHITNENKIRTWIIRLIAILISGYGVYALMNRRFLSYITLSIQFAFFDYKEPVFLYELDLFAMTALMVFVGYYAQKILIQLNKRKTEIRNGGNQ